LGGIYFSLVLGLYLVWYPHPGPKIPFLVGKRGEFLNWYGTIPYRTVRVIDGM